MSLPTPLHTGFSLWPFRALRFTDSNSALGAQLCPPYDVISAADRAALVRGSSTNAVRLVLPTEDEAELGDGNQYLGARLLMSRWTERAVLALDPEPALYVYELAAADGAITRGLLGAVELRDPDDGIILPHENTMAGPVSDRLALMSATQANLEPIYLVYEGGGAATQAVAAVSDHETIAEAITPDGTKHRLWALTDSEVLADIAADLSSRRALIADGHHRYATYRHLQAEHHGVAGPWDRGLTLLVDTSRYGPQVHPIHRVIQLGWEEILRRTVGHAHVSDIMSVEHAGAQVTTSPGFAIALAYNADNAVVVTDLEPGLYPEVGPSDADAALALLDVNVLHRVVIEGMWSLPDDEDTVGYAHNIADALAAAHYDNATAVLLKATPVDAVARVAAAGGRMPRKSTLFTPKPASGLVMRRFVDELGTGDAP